MKILHWVYLEGYLTLRDTRKTIEAANMVSLVPALELLDSSFATHSDMYGTTHEMRQRTSPERTAFIISRHIDHVVEYQGSHVSFVLLARLDYRDYVEYKMTYGDHPNDRTEHVRTIL